MANMPAIDLARIAQGLNLPAARVETVVDLLDAGNTVPFITRYRKDQTGGLDEEQIRDIQERVVKARLLAERQQTILRSIESQGKLTPELSTAILAADTTKRLEDLYLPYKPKKQTLATQARERGLEPLALEILNADSAAADLDARAKDFVNPDKKVANGADALLGAGHILAEMFAERADLRGKLRAIFESTGMLVTTGQEPENKPESKQETKSEDAASEHVTADEHASDAVVAEGVTTEVVEPTSVGEAVTMAQSSAEAAPVESLESEPTETAAEEAPETLAAPAVFHHESDPGIAATGEIAAAISSSEGAPPPEAPTTESPTVIDASAAAAAPAAKKRPPKGKKKKGKEAKKEGPDHRAFRDYFNYREALPRIPPHRVLAINRGEREKVLRVKIDFDVDKMYAVIDELLVPAEHPHAIFLRGCGRDALDRLVLPSLEREVRRELTDQAEAHAVHVFARNLRNLLLQPPVRGRRLLAIDPGYKSGCKLVAMDEFGTVLEHGLMHIIGKEERRVAGRAKLVEMVKNHQLNTIVVGNGTGCRETERMIGDLIATELAEQNVTYVIVNEAGASVYSTSRLGREEFPNFDATVRGCISIGRRLLDPLSELVKIEPPNLGVGMYQHDVKAKHLRDSLDAVVESCVNFVAVDLNTASPALLRYVSGLNQLTAQRLFDYRHQNGPFKSREQLKSVSGIGEGTYVQAAGFLKIDGGENPLDATWIHPESYSIADQVLAKLGFTPADLADRDKGDLLAERIAQLDVEELARETNVGAMTLRDIVAQLARPGRDPRESLPPPLFKKGVLKLDDLSAGMELDGTILNVVDFGAFVDIGLKDSGLVHISQLADRYVQDAHEVVAVGDIVKVWVMEVDKQRRRVSLTMIKPGSKRQHPERRPGQERGPRPDRPPRPAGQGRPPRPAGQGQPQGDGQAPPSDQRRQRRPPRPARPAVQGAQGEGAAAQQGSTGAPSQGSRSDSRPPSQGRPAQSRPPQGRPIRGGGLSKSNFGGGPPGAGKPKKKDKTVATMLTSAMLPKKDKASGKITKDMREGKTPMRTFGDLKQFFTKPPEESTESKKDNET